MSSCSFTAEAEALLAESVSAAQEREATAFDASACGAESVVVFGAGAFGQKVAAALTAEGTPPAAFADNNRQLWEKRIDGLEVFAPSAAAQRFGQSAAFVPAIFHPRSRSAMLEVTAQLRALRCRWVVPFPLLLWKYPERLLPYFLWELPSKILAYAEGIREAFAVLHDSASRQELLAQLRLRLRADFDHLPPPSDSPQYFPDDVFSLSSQECFIDCGAYDGDTIRSFVQRTSGHFRRIVAFEPDPANFARLHALVESSPELRGRVAAFPYAVGSDRSKVRFAATGAANAAMAEQGEVVVECTTLDEALSQEFPTLIKMDVEGAETDALRGGAAIVQRHNPVLAICVYHRPQDLWRIPVLLHKLQPDAYLSIRPHCADGLDLVCYSVPPARAAKKAGEGNQS